MADLNGGTSDQDKCLAQDVDSELRDFDFAELDALVMDVAQHLGNIAQLDQPFGERTTYRVGGRAALWVTVESEDDLELVVEVLRSKTIPTVALGRGSNVVVSDHGWPGMVISLGGKFSQMLIESDKSKADSSAGTIEAGGALALPVLARQSALGGWSGLEWAVGIPGSVGGAVKMNAGGHGSDVKASVIDADVVNLRSGIRCPKSLKDLDLQLRRSSLLDHEVVLSARFAVARGDPDVATAAINGIVKWRRENQPGGRNAGSVFKNPTGYSAGALIDQAGCKGERFNSAEVSTKHANFILSEQGGRAEDIARLAMIVREKVAIKSGIILEPEVHFIGKFDSIK